MACIISKWIKMFPEYQWFMCFCWCSSRLLILFLWLQRTWFIVIKSYLLHSTKRFMQMNVIFWWFFSIFFKKDLRLHHKLNFLPNTSRLRDLQSYHFDKTTESKQIHPYQGRLAVPGHLAVLAAAVVFVLGVSCAAAAAQWYQSWRISASVELLESLVAPRIQKWCFSPYYISSNWTVFT